MENKSKLFSIYGARISKSKKRVNISVVTGADNSREWGTISVPIEGTGKTKVIVDNKQIIVTIPLLEASKNDEVKEEVKDEELPF